MVNLNKLQSEAVEKKMNYIFRKWELVKGKLYIAGVQGWMNYYIRKTLNSAYKEGQKGERKLIIKEIDELENRMGETSMEEWRLFKHIRNTLRDNVKNLEKK